MRHLTAIFATLLAAGGCHAAVYQYSAASGSRRAYLWAPPRCSHLRGAIVSMANLLERNWLEDPIVRQAAAEECLGAIWIGPGRGGTLVADMNGGSGEALERLLADLAKESGYEELRDAPMIAMGHSANGQFSWTAANWNAQRIIAAIPVKTVPLPASLAFTGVPLCYLVGQTTEWPQYRDGRQGDRDFFWPVVRDSALRLRAADEHNLIGVVTDPGGGHFDWSERQARFVALYIRKACKYRLPKSGIHLRPIMPESGWLTDSGGMQPDRYPPAPYRQYRGDPKRAYWFFDEETARAAVAFCGDRKERQKQMLTFVQNGRPLPVAVQGFAPLQLPALADDLTFRLEGAFLSEVPPELLGSGTPLGHASGSIRFRVITGPAVQLSKDTFRIQFDRAGMGGALWILEEHPGDDRYRHAVQPGQMTVPARLTKGPPQAITFPPIPDQPPGAKSVSLLATSDSGLPVDYYVAAGPAELDGSRLVLTEIPASSRYPVKITVVAYQWGRTKAPAYQSAEPVERSFVIERRGRK